jgi:small conductance mechanosensitive channel
MTWTALASQTPMRFDWATVHQRMTAELYRLLAAAPLLLAALSLTLTAWWFGGWLARRAVVDRLARRNPFLKNLLSSSIKGGTVLLGVAAGLQLLNATAIVGALLGTAGLVGLALGFAFKDIVENYIAGVLLSLRQPFRPHDHVKIAEHEGLVMAMTARATVLMTLDGNNLRVPNAIVFKSVILNFSQNASRRFEFDLSVPIDGCHGVDQAGIARRVAAVHGVMSDPAVDVFVVAGTKGEAVVRVRGWVDQRVNAIDEVRGVALYESTAWLMASNPPDSDSAQAGDAAVPTRSSGPDGSRQHLLREGNLIEHSGDLLDSSAPVE